MKRDFPETIVPARRAYPGRAARWRTFVRERVALPALLAVGAAQGASAQYLVRPTLDYTALTLATAGIAGLLLLLRIMDEIKDVGKDQIAHPERPLPRGLLTVNDVRQGLRWVTGTLLGGSLLLAATTSWVAGALYALSVLYALLMYREFFAPRFLEARPFLYALTHQVVLLPLYAFATAVAAPESSVSTPVLWFGLTGLGASFAYEVCRKLDPNAHPVLRTYLTVHGTHRTVAAVIVSVALLLVATVQIEVQVVVWPPAALLLATLPLIYLRPERFRLVEGAATALVLAQVLGPTMRRLLETLR